MDSPHKTSLAASGHDPEALRYAFELSSALVSCSDYHAMTHQLLSVLSSFPGIKKVSSYEVFTPGTISATATSHPDEFLFRRFPLSLNDDYEDENTPLLKSMLASSHGGLSQCRQGNAFYTLMDILDKVNPRRAVLIEGELDTFQQVLVQGLQSVYSQQTALLDKKERDLLTHLLNRQSLDHVMNQILEYYRSAQTTGSQGTGSWLAILDIDYFKKVNDEFGHLFGDEVLIHFANLMKSTFRFSDYLFRFGGEEFLVILNQVDAGRVLANLERFRKAIESFTFPSGQITVSIGYTRIVAESNLSALVEQADTAVYAAKEMGRNQTAFYDEIKQNYQLSRHSGDDVELF